MCGNALAASLPLLANHVVRIVLRRAEKQMGRANTSACVTGVTDKLVSA